MDYILNNYTDNAIFNFKNRIVVTQAINYTILMDVSVIYMLFKYTILGFNFRTLIILLIIKNDPESVIHVIFNHLFEYIILLFDLFLVILFCYLYGNYTQPIISYMLYKYCYYLNYGFHF